MSVSANVLAPQTELEAVNTMLSVIGLAQITALTDPLPAEADMARFLLREQTREVQNRQWKFNTEFGYQLKPFVANFVWTNLDATTKLLNIFKPPTLPSNAAGLVGILARFDVLNSPVNGTQFTTQSGSSNTFLDVVLRMSTLYLEAGNPVLVFYDRANNCDGPLASSFPFIYLNLTWAFGFEYCPQSLRSFVAIRAGRMLAQRFVGSAELGGFAKQDEDYAWREFRRDQEEDDDYNLFDTADAQSFRGIRPGPLEGVFDSRGTPR